MENKIMLSGTCLLPNFLIIGAAKSGTTSLYEYLKGHPQVFMPECKEPAFFANPLVGGIKDWDAYCELFSKCTQEIAVGEASVAYLADPDSPDCIQARLGNNLKLIAILRNPVNMAYSNWAYQCFRGLESESFEQAIEEDEERSDPEWGRARNFWSFDMAHITRASYAPQLQRYIDTFGAEKIKVFIFEEFFQPGLPQFSELCRFLGVDDSYLPKQNVHNAASKVRSLKLRSILNKRMSWKEPFKKIMPQSIRNIITNALRKLNRAPVQKPELTPSTRAALEQIFSPDVRRLENILGRSLSEVWF